MSGLVTLTRLALGAWVDEGHHQPEREEEGWWMGDGMEMGMEGV